MIGTRPTLHIIYPKDPTFTEHERTVDAVFWRKFKQGVSDSFNALLGERGEMQLKAVERIKGRLDER